MIVEPKTIDGRDRKECIENFEVATSLPPTGNIEVDEKLELIRRTCRHQDDCFGAAEVVRGGNGTTSKWPGKTICALQEIVDMLIDKK